MLAFVLSSWQVLYKICDELPSTAEKIACNITVKTEGKHIVSEIESGVAPSQVCRRV